MPPSSSETIVKLTAQAIKAAVEWEVDEMCEESFLQSGHVKEGLEAEVYRRRFDGEGGHGEGRC